ncbi:MAG: aldo/keto reductase [Candidatus Marinimicrobia bacterium]|nr:aldo/keto reductase [Candidatus Neomarinimicrobiota bacterium]
MQYRRFESLDWKTSEIGFGAWAIGGDAWGEQDDSESLKALNKALDLGVNFIDTAQAYGNGHSEELIGKVLRNRGQTVGGGSVKVATKIPPKPGHWPPFPDDNWQDRFPEDYLRERVEFSLKKLGAETLDIVQLHSWTRAWNADPVPLHILNELKEEGKISGVGISTPEHDQNSVIRPMREDLLDSVQLIYNIFEQEPQAELLPAAQENGVGVIVRVVFDEGSLTGKFTKDTTFPDGDFRNRYFSGDRLERTVERVNKIQQVLAEYSDEADLDMPTLAIRFALRHPAVSVVIPGIRNEWQAKMNCQASDADDIPEDLYNELKLHNWRKAFWYGG